MKIAMFASEANPLVKTGGLADVVHALSRELALEGHDVIIALPYYASIKAKKLRPRLVGNCPVHMSWRQQSASIYRKKIGKVTYYLIGNDYYFDRPNCYGYGDDGERFAFFAIACRNLLPFVGFKADIVHVHDWQSAMVPVLIKEENRGDAFYKGMRFVLTIHNPAFKGYLDRFNVNDFFNLSDSLYDEGKLRLGNAFSTLKSGIVYADKVTTVSPTHRNELLDPNSEHGLSEVLRTRENDFAGFANGIDVDEWNPAKDPFIAANYDSSDWKDRKSLNRDALLKAFNIGYFGGPVYGMVSRLSWQKGIDLVLAKARAILSSGGNLVVLGSGEYELEQEFEKIRSEYPDTCGIYIGYNNELAHLIYAGCDYFLMPSLFEPCGISQMIAQRYGSLPIVRKTGGLADTVVPYEKGKEDGTGIAFNDYNVEGLGYAIGLAKELWLDKRNYRKTVDRAMKVDHSWKASCALYLGMYRELLGK